MTFSRMGIAAAALRYLAMIPSRSAIRWPSCRPPNRSLPSIACSAKECDEKTCGQLPTRVSRGTLGPRLQAVLSQLAGAYRLGKRPIPSLAAA